LNSPIPPISEIAVIYSLNPSSSDPRFPSTITHRSLPLLDKSLATALTVYVRSCGLPNSWTMGEQDAFLVCSERIKTNPSMSQNPCLRSQWRKQNIRWNRYWGWSSGCRGRNLSILLLIIDWGEVGRVERGRRRHQEILTRRVFSWYFPFYPCRF